MNYKNKNFNGKNQLQPNSNLFLQLGIILALAIVYSVFELKITKEVFIPPQNTFINKEPLTYAFPDFEIEKEKNPLKEKEQTVIQELKDFIIDNNPDDPAKDILFNPKPQQPKINIDSLLSNLPKDDDETKEVIPFIKVEQAPRFPECKCKTEEEFRICFNEKISQFVARRFHPDLNSTFQGKQKVYVQFEINAEGNILNIRARSPYKQLEKEAIEVIEKLPKMIPAKQRNINVSIRYNLPIVIRNE